MSPPSDKELEERLNAAGTQLLRPPSSVQELISLLDETEDLLTKVEQSPAKSMHTALTPLMKALVAEDLLKHSDVDVKVGVASCISEITRITAPDAPYNDGQMKDVFQLIVSSFENMSDTSNRSYVKRTLILETVAKVRSCVIMLDLECDQMIVDMFKHFLKDIRDNHGEGVFTSMETIMTLVIEESEDISLDLLHPILATLERNNKAVLPIAKKLAEKVIKSCADKLKSHLIEAVKTLNASLDDYSEVVASLCHENTGTGDHSNENICKEKQVAKDGITESSTLAKSLAVDGSPKSIASSGVNETGTEDNLTDANYSKTESHGLRAQKPSIVECAAERKGKQFKSKKDPAESSVVGDEKQAEEDQEVVVEEVRSSPSEVPSIETAKDNERENGIQLSPSEAPENEDVKASPTQSGSLPEESHSKNFVQAKSNENLDGEEADSADTASKKVSEGDNISEESQHHEEENVASPAQSGSLSEENQSKSSGPTKRNKIMVDDSADSADSASKKVSEDENMPVAKKQKQKQSKNSAPAKRKELLVGDEADSADTASKKVSEGENMSDAKKQKQSKYTGQAKRKQNLIGEEADSADTASKKVPEVENIVEAKKPKQKRSGRKRPAALTNKDKALTEEGMSKNDGGSSTDSGKKLVDASNKEENEPPSKKESRRKIGRVNKDKIIIEESASKNDGGSTSDDTRSQDQTAKQVDAVNKSEGGSLTKKEDKKKSGRVKPKPEKDVTKSAAREDDDKETVNSPSSPLKSTKDGNKEETPKTSTKRKRTPATAKDKVTSPSSPLKSTKDGSNKDENPKTNSKRKQTPGTNKPSEIIYDENLVGSKVKVWWPDDEEFYDGIIASYDSGKKKHQVKYTDGDVEVLNLKKERWEFVVDDPDSDGDQGVEHSGHDATSDINKKRKNKATPSSEASNKRAKMDNSSKGKKDTATKSGGKSKIDGKAEQLKPKDKYSKPVEESEDENTKSKDRLQKHGGKSNDDSTKASGKSKDVDVGKGSSRSKQDSQKPAKSKGKTPQTGKASDTKGTGKSSASKVKETDPVKEKAVEEEKLSEMGKGKSPDVSKSKSAAKKRRR